MRIEVVDALQFVRMVARDVARPSDVDDVVQEVALRLLLKPADLRDPDALRGFLRTTTRRESARLHARRGRDLPAGLLGDADETVPAAVVDDEGPAERDGTVPRDLFGNPVLPPVVTSQQAAAVRLHYFDGLPCAVVARRLGTTRGAVKVLLHRARNAMRGAK